MGSELTTSVSVLSGPEQDGKSKATEHIIPPQNLLEKSAILDIVNLH